MGVRAYRRGNLDALELARVKVRGAIVALQVVEDLLARRVPVLVVPAPFGAFSIAVPVQHRATLEDLTRGATL